jgi:hypothetical protein
MRLYLLILFLVSFGSVFTQTTPGLPYSISKQVRQISKFLSMPSVDAEEEISKNDLANLSTRVKIQQYGKALDVDFDVLSTSEKNTLPNGDVVYQLGIECKNAVSINVVFDRFKLKMGSRLYLVGANSSNYIGAYTSLNNSDAQVLGTELLNDSKIIIELVEPKANVGTSVLHLSSVIHGFRSLEAMVKRGFNGSGICNIDVNCPQGKGFEQQRNAVALMINSTGGFCTGTLMNTTIGPYKPYFLSANHCGADPTSWIFRFRWESPEENADCGTSKPSVDAPKDMTINGAKLLASYKLTDFLLCELNATPNPSWNVTYAGWDKSGDIPKSGAGIHHPYGDIKKISLDYKPLVAESFVIGEPLNHWLTNWNVGITESGSSGSPLFDQNHRVVGQLHGGDSDCISKFMTDFYGKLSESWNGGGTPESRLSDWLDPVDARVDFIDQSSSITYDPYISYHATNLTNRLCVDSIVPYIIISNGGIDTLKTLTISYAYDSDPLNQISWKGQLALYEQDTVYLPMQKFNKGNHVFSATILKDPNFADAIVSNNSFSSSFNVLSNPRKYVLELQLDTEGNEIAWYLTDSTNKTWYQGGPYLQTATKPALIKQEFCLEANCYKFSIYDNAGDGLYSSDYVTGSYTLYDDSKSVVAQLLPANAKFGSSSVKSFCFTNGLDQLDFEDQITLFPNPSNLDVLSINSENIEIKSIELYTISGQLYGSYLVNSMSFKLSIDQLQSGMYYLKIHGGNSDVTKSFVRY